MFVHAAVDQFALECVGNSARHLLDALPTLPMAAWVRSRGCRGVALAGVLAAANGVVDHLLSAPFW